MLTCNQCPRISRTLPRYYTLYDIDKLSEHQIEKHLPPNERMSVTYQNERINIDDHIFRLLEVKEDSMSLTIYQIEATCFNNLLTIYDEVLH